jgi:hypothetical protein
MDAAEKLHRLSADFHELANNEVERLGPLASERRMM